METQIIESGLIERAATIGRFVGNTPLFPLENIYPNKRVKIFAKLEWLQLAGSVKSRPAYNIVKTAIENGDLHHEKTLLDASSGNTAIAYAAIGASLGIKVAICLPENASEERKKILQAYGVEIIYTSKFGSTDEAQEIARSKHQEFPDLYFYADQYNNEANWKAHYLTTGKEIIDQTDGQITHFVAGLGTTGTFTGTGRRLKAYNKDINLTGLQPDAAMHGLEGWKHLETAILPGIYDEKMIEQRLDIDTMDAYDMVKLAASKEGLLISPSSGANLAGALRVADQLDEGVVVTIFPDNAEKYSEVMNNLFQ